MSEQEIKSVEESVEDVAAGTATAAHESGRQTGDAPQKSSSGVAWLALLLVLALAGGAAWLLREAGGREAALLEREAGLLERVSGLESIAGQKQSNLDALSEQMQGDMRSGLGAMQVEIGNETARLSQALASVESQLGEQEAELARFSANDRDSWLMAEAEYLLRLANQRLIMAGDTVAAQALLGSADDVLREVDDIGLHDVRAAVAADMAAVRAVPKVDVEGIYLRLAALIEQSGELVIFRMQGREEQPLQEAAPDWQGRLRQGYEAALEKLSDYIIIRRRDVPMQALMDPQWEGLVRQNLRMLLEQSQVALLSGNETLYRESLGRAQHWVVHFLESDEAAARAIVSELRELGQLTVAVTLPDISRSLRSLDDAIEQRLQQGGGE